MERGKLAPLSAENVLIILGILTIMPLYLLHANEKLFKHFFVQFNYLPSQSLSPLPIIYSNYRMCQNIKLICTNTLVGVNGEG